MAYTTIDDPSAYFQTALHSSANAATITNDGNSDLQPDLIWSKARGAAHNHGLYDSTRGVTKFVSSNATSAETTASSGYDLTSFNTDGFSTGNNQYNTICGGTTYVAWQWKANGGTTSSNTDGTLTTTVQANQDAGFSIVTWTGVGGTRTVGHGLGQAPAMVICKNRTISSQWLIWHQGLTGPGYQLLFNTGAMGGPGGNLVQITPTSTVFKIGSSAEVSNNCVAYCFAEKQGYSKFGSYVGNGSTNGTFVYTGFKPAFIMCKRIDGAGNSWDMHDSARDPSNPSGRTFYADTAGAELTGNNVDLLSNGFKQRDTSGNRNGNGNTYIYMAFAENPFVTSTGTPTTAR